MTELYGIWFEKSGWFAPYGDGIYSSISLNVAFAQLRVLRARNKGRAPEPNVEVGSEEWYDVARVAMIGEDGLPAHFVELPGLFPRAAIHGCHCEDCMVAERVRMAFREKEDGASLN